MAKQLSNPYVSVSLKSKWVWSGSTTITYCRPTHGTVRKKHRIFIVTIHLWDNNSKATSFLFLLKMIAKLEWTQSNSLSLFYNIKRPSPVTQIHKFTLSYWIPLRCQRKKDGKDQTGDPWICNQKCICCQTRYRLHYAARDILLLSHGVSWVRFGTFLLNYFHAMYA